MHVSGRPWSIDELRGKSGQDLQILWYKLLQEKNMLASEKRLYRGEGLRMPNPSRKNKVKTSMARLQTVLTERRSLGVETHQAWVDAKRQREAVCRSSAGGNRRQGVKALGLKLLSPADDATKVGKSIDAVKEALRQPRDQSQ